MSDPTNSTRCTPRLGAAWAALAASAAMLLVGARPARAAVPVTMDRLALSRVAIGAHGAAARTRIGFRTSRAGSVDVVVATQGGQVVRNLYSGTRPAGAAHLTWNGVADDGHRVPDGTYDVLIAATNGGAPTTSLVGTVVVDSTAPTLGVARTGTFAKLAQRRVWLRIPVHSSEEGSVRVVAKGGSRRGYVMPISAGANTVSVTAGTLGIPASKVHGDLDLTLLVTDAAGNTADAAVQVAVPTPAPPTPTPTPAPAPPPTPTAPAPTGTTPVSGGVVGGGPTTVQPFTVDASLPLRTRIVQIAQSQVGVVEVGNNGGPAVDAYRASVVGGTGAGDTAWCAYFASWVFNEAGAGLVNGHGDGLVAAIGDWAKSTGRFLPPGSPGVLAGDAIFTTGEGDHWTDHMGIVESVDPTGTIHTIEGNDDDGVRRNSYAPNDPQIKGYLTTP